MKPELIRSAATSEAKSKMMASSLFLAACLLVLLWNWKYVFNWTTGPVPITAALAVNPGAREFVTASGEMLPTDGTEQAKLTIHGFAFSERVSAKFMLLQMGNRLLLIKVPPEFAGSQVAGRLTPLPAELASAIKDKDNSVFLPRMIDAKTPYRLDFNLFVLGAAILFPFAAFFFIRCWQRSGDIARNPSIARLKRFGAPLHVMESVEADLQGAGDAARIGPLVLTKSWVVVLEPSLKIYASDEVAAVAKEARAKKSGSGTSIQHLVNIWIRGKLLSEEVDLPESQVAQAMDRVAAIHRWMIVENAPAFGSKWSSDRAACERESDQRRAAKASAH